MNSIRFQALDTEADKLKRDNKQLIEKIDQLTAKMKEEHKDDSIAGMSQIRRSTIKSLSY